MIDLHMHTTASDGRCTPEELVERCYARGIRTMAITDHDTMAGVEPAQRAAAARGITCLPGIEITSAAGGRNVHMLAYFLAPDTPGLQSMLETQRRQRAERAVEIAARLQALGAPVDTSLMMRAALDSGTSLARPHVARALVEAGHVATIAEAFDRYLGEDSPAYVPHTGVSSADVVALVVSGGGIPSLAHPGYRPHDEIIPDLVDAGLVGIEAYHSSHDAAATAHYLGLAARYGLIVTGGSDFHGPGTRRAEFFGVVSLPPADLDVLLARARR